MARRVGGCRAPAPFAIFGRTVEHDAACAEVAVGLVDVVDFQGDGEMFGGPDGLADMDAQPGSRPEVEPYGVIFRDRDHPESDELLVPATRDREIAGSPHVQDDAVQSHE